ncbi:MAG: phosphatase PAP2 family protein [Bacteroidales bacterium]|nr:phosphatase PAP2 family protein [Bacteroidales bacterium]
MKSHSFFLRLAFAPLVVVAMLFSVPSVLAQGSKPYLSAQELPDALYWLPAPPAPGSSQFMYDISQYYWGKAQRLDTARASKAIREAQYEIEDMARQFSTAFGMEISPKATPAIYRLLDRGLNSIRLSGTKPKATYMRTRPYVYFNEPTLVPADEEVLRTNGSYPSGHTLRGWGMALLLCEVNPAAQNELLKLAYEWGQSRVIAGFHWQSDVDASRMLAAACYARLHTCQAFIDDMAAAQKEYTSLSKKNH